MNPTPLTLRLAVWSWLVAALFLGNSGLLSRWPALAFPSLIATLTALSLLAISFIPPWRRWVTALDLRALVLLHTTRFVGIYFLLLYQRGELPYAFAVPGGWGDIIVAALALVVAFAPVTEPTRRRAITIWNVIGFVDILLVVATAGRLALQVGATIRALTYLPLSLLPTFLVPVIIATHLVIFERIRREPVPA